MILNYKMSKYNKIDREKTMMKTISQEDIIESVKNENPWWETSQIHEQFAKLTPRPYIQLFYPLVTERSIQRAVVLMGPRRVGKTVMIHHTIQRLISASSKIPHCSLSRQLNHDRGLPFSFVPMTDGKMQPSE